MDLIKALNEKQLQAEKPQVNVGDTVKVHSRSRKAPVSVSRSLRVPSLLRSTAASRKPSPSVACPMAWVWRRFFPFTPPPSRKSRPCAAVLSAAPSCTICVTGSARPPRSERSCKQRAENRRPLSAVFMSKTKSQQTSFSPADSFGNICNIRYTAECSHRTHHGW